MVVFFYKNKENT